MTGRDRHKQLIARCAGVLALALLAVGIAPFVLQQGYGAGAGWVLAWFGIPFAIGVLVAMSDPDRGRGRVLQTCTWVLAWAVVTCILMAVLLGEAAICILIVFAPLVLASVLGAWMTHLLAYGFQKRRPEATRPAALLMALLVLGGTLAFDLTVPAPRDSYSVARSIDIAAPPEAVWPLLLDLRDIAETEGTANLTQSVLQVPRPRSAVVVGQGVGAVRHGRWGPHVSFEEHLTSWSEGQSLGWRFVFPNDSVQIYTDRRIAPDGPLLFIETGGYRLEARPDGGTRLTLTTSYAAVTHMNAWASLWGEIMIGDIQTNILTIIRDRAESARLQPQTVYQVGQTGHTPSNP